MGAWRVKVWIKRESTVGVEDTTQNWRYIGTVTDFSMIESNNVSYNTTLGSKFYDTASAGKYTGSGSFGTLLDFNNFYYLNGTLEDYTKSTRVVTVDSKQTRVYDHIFQKSNKKKIPSFTILVRKLNRGVGGSRDQETKLYGCFLKSVNPSWDGSTANVKTTIQFEYLRPKTKLGDLDTLDDGVTQAGFVKHQVEWGCLQIFDDTQGYVGIANNEKTGFTLSSNIKAIGQCGSRFNADYSEANTSQFAITNTVYSRNPEQWLLRIYSGGYDNTLDPDQTVTYEPKKKYLKPIERMRICSSDTKLYQSVIDLEDVWVEGWTMSFNPTNQITEAPTLKAKKLVLTITTPDVPTDIYDGTPIPVTPYLEIVSPANNFASTVDTINVIGFTDTDATLSITVNGTPITAPTIEDNGSFNASVTLTAGTNTIVVANGTKSITLTGTYTAP